MLSKLYLCNTGYNNDHQSYNISSVVNCFQNCTFVILDTTDTEVSPRTGEL